MNIVGIAGKAGSGKDVIAEYLVDVFGYHRRAWADSLKDAAGAIFGLTREQMYGGEKEVVDRYWGHSPRYILQKLGTECLRQGYGKDVWIRSFYRHISQQPMSWFWVVPDVRFENEARAIREWGGRLWRVDRPGVGEVGMAGHASEHDLDNWVEWDQVLVNDGTVLELLERVEALI